MADRFGYGEIGLDIHPCRGCEDYDAPDGCKSNGGCGKPTTNADRLRAMSDEELADLFLEWVACDDCPVIKSKCKREWANCKSAALAWLKAPAKEGDG